MATRFKSAWSCRMLSSHCSWASRAASSESHDEDDHDDEVSSASSSSSLSSTPSSSAPSGRSEPESADSDADRVGVGGGRGGGRGGASSPIAKAANRSEGRSNPEAGSRRWWLLLLRSERVKRPCSDRSSPSREMTNWMVESLPAVDWIPSRGRGRVDSSSQSSTAIGSVVLAELPDEERPSRRRDARWGRW